MPLILRLFVNYVLGYLVNHVTIPNRFLPRDPLLWLRGTFGEVILPGVTGLRPSQRKAPSEPPTGWAAGGRFVTLRGSDKFRRIETTGFFCSQNPKAKIAFPNQCLERGGLKPRSSQRALSQNRASEQRAAFFPRGPGAAASGVLFSAFFKESGHPTLSGRPRCGAGLVFSERM